MPSSWVSVLLLIHESSYIILVFSKFYLSLLCVWNREDESEHKLVFFCFVLFWLRWEVLHRLLLSVPNPFPIQFLSFLSELSISEFLFGTLQAALCPYYFTHFHKGHWWPPDCSVPQDLSNPVFLNCVAIITGDIFFLGILSFLGLCDSLASQFPSHLSGSSSSSIFMGRSSISFLLNIIFPEVPSLPLFSLYPSHIL